MYSSFLKRCFKTWFTYNLPRVHPAELIRKFAPFQITISLSQTQLARGSRQNRVHAGRAPQYPFTITRANTLSTNVLVRAPHRFRASYPSVQRSPPCQRQRSLPNHYYKVPTNLPSTQSTASQATSTLPSFCWHPAVDMGKNRRCGPGRGAVPCVSGTRRRRLRSATSNQKDGTSPTPQSRPRSPSPPSLSGAGRRSYRIAGEAPRPTLASTTNLNQKEQLHNQNTPKRLSPILLHAHSQLRAPSRRSSRLGGGNEPNKELLGLSPPRIRKR